LWEQKQEFAKRLHAQTWKHYRLENPLAVDHDDAARWVFLLSVIAKLLTCPWAPISNHSVIGDCRKSGMFEDILSFVTAERP
jgi:hypothetical protein